tara:strand:- start:26265 stop:34055 length:7791 start_codon:yes stop_codon:yes gene_type:complete
MKYLLFIREVNSTSIHGSNYRDVTEINLNDAYFQNKINIALLIFKYINPSEKEAKTEYYSFVSAILEQYKNEIETLQNLIDELVEAQDYCFYIDFEYMEKLDGWKPEFAKYFINNFRTSVFSSFNNILIECYPYNNSLSYYGNKVIYELLKYKYLKYKNIPKLKIYDYPVEFGSSKSDLNFDLKSIPELKNIYDIFSISCRDRASRYEIAINDTYSMNDIEFILDNILDNCQELILVFKGEKYKDYDKRLLISNIIYSNIKKYEHTKLLYSVFLTKHIDENLFFDSLISDTEKVDEEFSSIRNDAGFLLTDSLIFDLIYKNRRKHYSVIKEFSLEHEDNDLSQEIEPSLINGDINQTVRKNKLLENDKLKLEANISLEQQINVQQDEITDQQINVVQEVNHTQSVNNTQVNSVQQSMGSGYQAIKYGYDENKIFEEIKKAALAKLKEIQLFKNSLSTNYIYSKIIGFYTKLIDDELFRKQYASRLFFLIKPECIESNLLIESNVAFWCLHNLDFVADGINYNSGFVRVEESIINFIDNKKYLVFNDSIFQPFRINYDDYEELNKDIFLSGKIKDFERFKLITIEQYDELSEFDKILISRSIDNLLNVFKSENKYSSDDILKLKDDYIIYCSLIIKNPQKIEILKNFIDKLDNDNIDYIKILLFINLSGNICYLDAFINIVTTLNNNAHIEYFHKIYFKYAKTLTSVSQFIYEITNGMKIEAPTVNKNFFDAVTNEDTEDPLQINKITLHVLIYTFKHGLKMHKQGVVFYDHTERLSIQDVRDLFIRIYNKILFYTDHNEAEAKFIYNKLLDNLLSDEDGFNIQGILKFRTFINTIEPIIDNAIKNNVLKEQVENLNFISFRYSDALFAIKFNDFYIVSKEMKLMSEYCNNRNYSVNKNNLFNDIEGLKVNTFRYLGQQKLRENLNFYREIYGYKCDNEIIKNLIIAYIVYNSTGKKYKTVINVQEIKDDLEHDANILNITKDEVNLHLSELTDLFNKTTKYKDKGNANLWFICKQEESFNVDYYKLPSLFSDNFNLNKLDNYLIKNKSEILANFCLLKPYFLKNIIDNIITSKFSANTNGAKRAKLIISTIYNSVNLNNLEGFLSDIHKINIFCENYNELTKGFKDDGIYLGLKRLSRNVSNIDKLSDITNILVFEPESEDCKSKIFLRQNFLDGLLSFPKIINDFEKNKLILIKLLEFYYNKNDEQFDISLLFKVTNELVKIDNIEEINNIFDILINKFSNQKWCDFFRNVNNQKLYYVFKLIEKYDIQPEILEYYNIGDEVDFNALLTSFNEISKKSLEQVLFILNNYLNDFKENKYNLLLILNKFKNISEDSINTLAILCRVLNIPFNDFIIVLQSDKFDEDLLDYEELLYTAKIDAFKYNPEEVNEKIFKIRFKNYNNELNEPLSNKRKYKLLKNYEKVFSFLPDYNKLNITLFQLKYNDIKLKLKSNQLSLEEKSLCNLQIIALSCIALLRTTGKFPRATQLISLLNQSGDLIQEIPTGEGKSIITALNGVLLVANSKTVDIATENTNLSKEHIKDFTRFYNYFSITCAEKPLESTSTYSDYIHYGINCSTPANFSLFRATMRLHGYSLPKNISLICDEVDAALTTTVQYRLAAPINRYLLNVKLWKKVYIDLLEFIHDRDLFKENLCSRKDDVTNFKKYIITKHNNKDTQDFISLIPDEEIDSLIDSALIADSLEESVDFVVLSKNDNSKSYTAAPINKSINRPDIRLSFNSGIQQLLHIKLSQLEAFKKHKLLIDPKGEVILEISAKNFFDFYRLNNENTISFTGTAGSFVEIKEFHEKNNFKVFSYPTFHKVDRKYIGFYPANDAESYNDLLLSVISNNKINFPSQPVLIIVDSPKKVKKLSSFLKENNLDFVQEFNGYDQIGISESQVINNIGQDFVITVATQSLSRGANPITSNKDGLLVINSCVDITESEYLQIIGRSARNGHVGKCCTVIDTSGTNIIKEEDFSDHRKSISIENQRKRLDRRLLEETRGFIIEQHFLSLRDKIDSVLVRQFGFNTFFIEHFEFMTILRDYNKKLEMLDLTNKENFLQQASSSYNELLVQWFPKDKFANIEIVEPRVPIEDLYSLTVLNQLTIAELMFLSNYMVHIWRYQGNANVYNNYKIIDKIIESLEPYFDNQCSFKFAAFQIADKKIEFDNIITGLDFTQDLLNQFVSDLKEIPMASSFISINSLKLYFDNYFAVTKVQIKQKMWDDLDIPIDFKAINKWFDLVSKLSTFSSIISMGTLVSLGPAQFIIDYIVIPACKKIFKKIADKSDSIYLQAISGIDDFLNSFRSVLLYFYNQNNLLDKKLGDVLDVITPLFNNKLLYIAFNKILIDKDGNKDTNINYEDIKQVISILNFFKEYTIKELFNSEVIIRLILQLSEINLFLKFINNSELNLLVKNIKGQDLTFLSRFKEMHVPDVFKFIKIIGHPEFNKFISNLPKDTSYEQIISWLQEQDIHKLPEEIKVSFLEFKDYQNNPERVAAESSYLLKNFHTKFELTPSKINGYLNILNNHDKFNEIKSNYFWSLLGYGVLASGLLTANIMFFSIPLMTVSIFIGIKAVYDLYNELSACNDDEYENTKLSFSF